MLRHAGHKDIHVTCFHAKTEQGPFEFRGVGPFSHYEEDEELDPNTDSWFNRVRQDVVGKTITFIKV